MNSDDPCGHYAHLLECKRFIKFLSKPRLSKIQQYYVKLQKPPSNLHCVSKCTASPSSLHLCLDCLSSSRISFFCYSLPKRSPMLMMDVKDHLLDHYNSTQHLLFFHFPSNSLYCAACDVSTSITSPSRDHPLFPILEPHILTPSTSVVTSTSRHQDIIYSLPFINLGNSCFFNSCIQALLAIPVFANYFQFSPQFQDNLPGSFHNIEVLKTFSKLSIAYYQTSFDSVDESIKLSHHLVKILWRQTRRALPQFSDYFQHDASEFLNCFLNTLHESFAGNDSFNSLVFNTFKGELNSSVKCHICKKDCNKREPFLDLSVPIAQKEQKKRSFWPFGQNIGSVTLYDCLDEYFKTENLNGDNKFECDTCHELVAASRTFSLMKSPEVLIIQLKRFKHTHRSSSKIKGSVSFPLENLDLSRYLHDNSKDQIVNHFKYDLVSIVQHHGGVHGGHYTSVVRIGPSRRDQKGSGSNAQPNIWELCDDSFISPFDLNSCLDNNGFCHVRDAYLLLYVKNSRSVANFDRSKMIDEVINSSKLLKLNGENLVESQNLVPVDSSLSIKTSALVNISQVNITSPAHNLSLDESNMIVVPGSWIYSFCYFAFPSILNTSFFNCPHDYVYSPRKISAYHPYVIPTELFSKICQNFTHVGPLIALKDVNSTSANSLVCRQCDLSYRRIDEKQKIYGLDTSYTGNNKVWFMISNRWLISWKSFIKNSTSMPPQSITNSDLVTSSGEVKPGLVQGNHYRSLSGPVFRSLYDIYGLNGPIIVRMTADIYSAKPIDEGVVALEFGKEIEYV
ncbi:hypothetical protein P9112_013905 [Eukaryota sp. TZLM1-RC]